MTSGGRELVKWLALLFMTGDHTLKILHLGYMPVIAELGRVAFPLFALVFAYNLAQPGADVAKLIKRLFLWGTRCDTDCGDRIQSGTAAQYSLVLRIGSCLYSCDRRTKMDCVGVLPVAGTLPG